jgi:hypothetical protein
VPRRMGIDVSPNKRDGGWVVKAGTEKVRHDTKPAAIDDAVARGRESGNARWLSRRRTARFSPSAPMATTLVARRAETVTRAA